MIQRALVVVPFLIASATAGQVSHNVTVGPVPIGGTVNATLPQFDGNLGVLRVARIGIFATVGGTVGFENTDAAPAWTGGYINAAGAIAPWSIGGIGGPGANPAYFAPQVQLAAYDGLTDYAGASGVTHAFSGESGDGLPNPWVDVYTDALLPTFVGGGTVAASSGPMMLSGASFGPNVAITRSVQVTVNFRVEYQYDPYPTVICRASYLSNCPCNNPGQMGAGCANSVDASGGTLARSGVSSIANDTLRLLGGGMTNSNALYFQGTGFQYAQSVYGDGLRCVTGSIVRLGTRTNVSGASQVPSVGGTPISVVGGVVTPGTRFYQVIYRDNGAYCTPSNFNATSGLAVVWTL